MLLRDLLAGTSLGTFSPRTMCFAEADAADAGGGGAEDDAPEIDVDEPDESNDNEPDDLEEVELDGRKAKIPKAWKDPLEQGKDYRYKTGKLAEEKRAVEADRTRYSDLIKRTEATLKASEPGKPDESMLDRTSEKYDPDNYHLQRARWEKWAQQAFNAAQERKRLEGEDAAKVERERGEKKTATQRELIKAIPSWKDASVKAADRVKMESYLGTLGVSPEEFAELDHDHRLTTVAYKAMMYDAAVAKARARKDDAPAESAAPAAPVRKVGGGGGSAPKGPPKSTDAYIKWRMNGGKM